MSTLVLPALTAPLQPPRSAPPWHLLGTTLVIGVAFFVSIHDINVSQAVAYTQTAEEMEIAAAGGNPIRRVAFLGVGAWGLLLLATARQPMRIDPWLAVPIGLLASCTFSSFLWSDDPGMCLRRLMVLGCCGLAAVGIARSLPLREQCWFTIGTLGTLAAVGVLAELRLGTFRPWESEYRFAGSVHPNTQGPGLAAVCLAAWGLVRCRVRGRYWLWAIAAAAFVLLLLTKSRTTAAAIVASAGLVWLAQTPLKWQALAGACAAFAGGLALWLIMAAGYDPLTDFRDALLMGRAEDSDTLSGRAFIWPEVLYFAGQRPWLGYGFESFWTPARIEIISGNLGWGLREAHNAYLESLLSLGGIGLTLVLLVSAAGLIASVRGYRATRDQSYALPLGLLIFGLINAGLESGMVTIELVPFILAAALMRLAFFQEAPLLTGAPA